MDNNKGKERNYEKLELIRERQKKTSHFNIKIYEFYQKLVGYSEKYYFYIKLLKNLPILQFYRYFAKIFAKLSALVIILLINSQQLIIAL